MLLHLNVTPSGYQKFVRRKISVASQDKLSTLIYQHTTGEWFVVLGGGFGGARGRQNSMINGSTQGIRPVAHKPDTVRSVGAAASCLKRSHECTELTAACHSGGKHHLDRPATPAVLLLAPR